MTKSSSADAGSEQPAKKRAARKPKAAAALSKTVVNGVNVVEFENHLEPDLDYAPLFNILYPICVHAFRHPRTKQKAIYKMGIDFMDGKLGDTIDGPIAAALYTVMDSYAKHIIGKDEIKPSEMEELKVIQQFCDFWKGLGIKLTNN